MAPEPPSEIRPIVTGAPFAWSGGPSAAVAADGVVVAPPVLPALLLPLEPHAARSSVATATPARACEYRWGLKSPSRPCRTIYLPHRRNRDARMDVTPWRV